MQLIKGGEIIILPGQSCYINIICKAKTVGKASQMVLFEFSGFKIGRQVSVIVQDPAEALLTARSQFERKSLVNKREAQLKFLQTHSGWIIPGEKPLRRSKLTQFPVRLSKFPVPEDIRDAILHHDNLELLRPCLLEPLSMSNYVDRFHTLLFTEEVQMEIEMREFDMQRVVMHPCSELLKLPVPGLAEGRPSLLIGDKVLVKESLEDSSGPVYEGYIHAVHSQDVLLRFNPGFHQNFNRQEFDVAFMFNRTPLQRIHQAVSFANNIGNDVLFPEQLNAKKPLYLLANQTTTNKTKGQTLAANHWQVTPDITREKTRSGFAFFDKSLNMQQRAAVTRVLAGQNRPIPYILFGPPGLEE